MFDLETLIGKLNPACRKALEAAAALCVSQTHYNVEIEHFLLKVLEIPNCDLRPILRYYEVNADDLMQELREALEKLKRGNSRTPTLSPHISQALEEAWVFSSLHLGRRSIRSGGLLLALLSNDTLRGVLVESCPSILQIRRESLKQDIRELIKDSEEADSPTAPGARPPQSRNESREGESPSKAPALDQYTIDLTSRARSGLVDPVHGRDSEIRRIIDILTRRRQNNPILTGEAGVGKTAVVEGFAIRIAKGDVPPALQGVSVRVLDLGLLQAGAGVKGEFENRLKSVIAEVAGSPHPIILFIDEAHTLIGAGAGAGQGDAANLLKPALARGELRTIAATTWSEYKKYFEKDPALARRFQVIKIDEPDEETAADMLRGAVANLERHHRVRILDEAVRDAVRLSHRYITGRYLPDKAISVLDTACARVAIGQNSTPPQVEDADRRIELLDIEIDILEREHAFGRAHEVRLAELNDERARLKDTRRLLNSRWEKERELVGRIRSLEAGLEDGSAPDPEQLVADLATIKSELEAIQVDEPMVPIHVNSKLIASVISGWTGIPVGKMLADEINTVLTLAEKMAERILGQDQALDMICRRIQTSRADLDDPGKPVGVFLLVGPSGVGKTETAIALADLLYGGERNMVVINMSEYQEPYTVSTLKGSPPGYVGYGKGGVLTEAVRRNPYSVVLLDEVEKAHPDVMELFYQVFDKGTLEDSEGVVVDFKNTIILLTGNVGAEVIIEARRGSAESVDSGSLVESLRTHLLKYFKPALLGRLVIVPYYPLGDREIAGIVRHKLAKIRQRFRENHRAELVCDESLVAAIASRCTEVDSGARNIDHILTQTLLPELSGHVLACMARGESFTGLHVSFDQKEGFKYELRG